MTTIDSLIQDLQKLGRKIGYLTPVTIDDIPTFDGMKLVSRNIEIQEEELEGHTYILLW